MEKSMSFSLVMGEQAYACLLVPYGQVDLYPRDAGVYAVVRLRKAQSSLSVVCLFANVTEGIAFEKLHNSQVVSKKPTHVLFYPKSAGGSLLQFYNQCHESYPPEVLEEDLAALRLTDYEQNSHVKNGYSPLTTNQPISQSFSDGQCGVCSGSGRAICSACGGTGGRSVMNSHIGYDGNPIYEPEWESCYSCSAGYVNCSACGGSG